MRKRRRKPKFDPNYYWCDNDYDYNKDDIGGNSDNNDESDRDKHQGYVKTVLEYIVVMMKMRMAVMVTLMWQMFKMIFSPQVKLIVLQALAYFHHTDRILVSEKELMLVMCVEVFLYLLFQTLLSAISSKLPPCPVLLPLKCQFE